MKYQLNRQEAGKESFAYYGYSGCNTSETKQDIPASFLRHYPAHKNGLLNISELARACDISRTTAYKYKSLLEA